MRHQNAHTINILLARGADPTHYPKFYVWFLGLGWEEPLGESEVATISSFGNGFVGSLAPTLALACRRLNTTRVDLQQHLLSKTLCWIAENRSEYFDSGIPQFEMLEAAVQNNLSDQVDMLLSSGLINGGRMVKYTCRLSYTRSFKMAVDHGYLTILHLLLSWTMLDASGLEFQNLTNSIEITNAGGPEVIGMFLQILKSRSQLLRGWLISRCAWGICHEEKFIWLKILEDLNECGQGFVMDVYTKASTLCSSRYAFRRNRFVLPSIRQSFPKLDFEPRNYL